MPSNLRNVTQHTNPPLQAGQNVPQTTTAARTSSYSPGGSAAEMEFEPAGRFVRAATLASDSGIQRMNVLMQDDQLGRISLRMVDRAGLIQAVVRTDGSRAAHVLTESLPVLMESLAQRGLAASWTSAQGQTQEQQSDPRQGRRHRQPGGQPSGHGSRRRGDGPEAVFRVEVQ